MHILKFTFDLYQAALQIFDKVGFSPIDNEKEKKVQKKYKPFPIPRKLMVTLLLSTTVMHKTNLD